MDVPSQSCVSLWSGADLHFGAESKFVGLESHEGNVFAAIQKGVWGVLRPNEAGSWGKISPWILVILYLGPRLFVSFLR